MIDRPELAAWLRLLETPGIGRETARRLLAAFGSPQAVFEASQTELQARAGAALAAEIRSAAPPHVDALTQATLDWLDASDVAARTVITLGDLHYPPQLLESPDPPLILYAIGRIELLSADALAIVGSRNPTAQGREHARRFAAELSAAGLTIVSGLALGIDAQAHLGALDGPGSTIAVTGTGLDRIYPARHRELAQRIAQHGVIVSEFALGMPPLAANFPQRNRIIAGLARATLVVEAALQSGSLITARLANEAGRDVMAIPGSIQSAMSRGCHALIQQGAKLAGSPQDVLDELFPGRPLRSAPTGKPTETSAPEDALLAALGHDPMTLDALARRTGQPPAELSVRLLQLELEGRVARLPGQLFQRVDRA